MSCFSELVVSKNRKLLATKNDNIFNKMSPQSTNIKKRHSFYTSEAPRTSVLDSVWKSDDNILNSTGNEQQKNFDEYYKKYEHDEIPVKDVCSFNDHSFSEGCDSGTGDNKDSITNSDLDKLEIKILSKMSQQLQTDVSSISSLDSNIKLFKITVQQIFDNFYSNMEDFELYKKRFNEILEKNKGDSISELEEFISNMIQHIGSSDSSSSHFSRDINITSTDKKTDNTREAFGSTRINEMNNRSYNLIKSSEVYKSDGSVTNSIYKGHPEMNSTVKKDEMLNIYLVSGSPCFEIKVNDRNLFSEINLREQCVPEMNNLASAENIKKLEAKKLELEKYFNQEESCKLERNIPVKNSNAKKNIYLNEDFELNQEKDENKFFIFKICSYICRKLRKS